MTETTWIDLVWCDLLGRPRTVRVAASALSDRHTVPAAVVTAGYDGPGAADGEVLLAPDEASAVRLPVEDGVVGTEALTHAARGDPGDDLIATVDGGLDHTVPWGERLLGAL